MPAAAHYGNDRSSGGGGGGGGVVDIKMTTAQSRWYVSSLFVCE